MLTARSRVVSGDLSAHQRLATGPLIVTERVGNAVVRRASVWLPRRLGNMLVRSLALQSCCFSSYVAVPNLEERQHDGRSIAVQRYLVNARPLTVVSREDRTIRALSTKLDVFWRGVEQCWVETGWLPDVGGRVYFPWELYNPWRSRNVLVDVSGNLWLVDPGATALFHHRRWPPARLHAALMLRSIRRARKSLDCEPRPPQETSV